MRSCWHSIVTWIWMDAKRKVYTEYLEAAKMSNIGRNDSTSNTISIYSTNQTCTTSTRLDLCSKHGYETCQTKSCPKLSKIRLLKNAQEQLERLSCWKTSCPSCHLSTIIYSLQSLVTSVYSQALRTRTRWIIETCASAFSHAWKLMRFASNFLSWIGRAVGRVAGPRKSF